MSIEQLLTDLTEAIRENTEALKGSGGGTTTKKSSGGTTTKKTTTKKAATKKQEVTVDEIAKRAGAFLKTGSKDEREAAKSAVKAIIDHFDADRITNIDPENFPEVLKLIDAYEAGEDPLAEEGNDESMI